MRIRDPKTTALIFKSGKMVRTELCGVHAACRPSLRLLLTMSC